MSNLEQEIVDILRRSQELVKDRERLQDKIVRERAEHKVGDVIELPPYSSGQKPRKGTVTSIAAFVSREYWEGDGARIDYRCDVLRADGSKGYRREVKTVWIYREKRKA